MKNIFLIIAAIATILSSNTSYASDLMTDYMNNNNNSADYRFGVNLPTPYNNSGGGQLASIGGNAGPNNKGCGFGALANITAQFNISALENLGTSIISGVPIMVLCYASQTLCDAYKFARNLANAAASLGTASCQQIEKLAMNTGTELRKDAVQNCIMGKVGSGSYSAQEFMEAADSCEGNSSNPVSKFLNEGGTATSFNLSDWVNKTYPPSENPVLNSTLKLITGDMNFSAGGISHTTPQKGIETMQSTYSQAYYNAVKNTIENSVSNGTPPSSSDLATISVPGYPMTPYFASKLTTLPSDMRNSFYSQYSTVAGTIQTLSNVQDLEDKLETAKANGGDPSKTAAVQGEIDKLKTRMGFLEKQMDIQAKYLAPMIGAVMDYKLSSDKPGPSSTQEMQEGMPTGVPAN